MTGHTAGNDMLDALTSLSTMSRPTVSPSGERIAIYYDDTGRNELSVIDVSTGSRVQWSDGNVPRDGNSPLAWWPGRNRVLVHCDEDGDEQYDIYAINEAGTLDAVVQSDGMNKIYDVDPDGEFVLVASTRDGQLNLYRHDFRDKDVTKVTDSERPIYHTVLSPDGNRMAYVTSETAEGLNIDVYLQDTDGRETRRLPCGTTGSETIVADWSLDGNRLLVGDNTEGRTQVGIHNLTTDETTWLGEGRYEEMPVQFHPNNNHVLALRDRDAMTVPVVYRRPVTAQEETSGRELDVSDGVWLFSATIRPDRRHVNDAVLADGRLLLTHVSSTTRRSLLAYDLDTGETETLLAPEYGRFAPEDFADSEYFRFDSNGVPESPQRAVEHEPAEQLDIGALLYDAGERPSPLVVKPHGGPRGRDAKRFSALTQLLVDRGFSVLEVNYRGSAGRGREFVEHLYGDVGGAEQGDIATGVEYVLDTHDWIDANRVAVVGGSYGGFSTYWQLIQFPDLYSAGAAITGATDWLNRYENTMPHYRTGFLNRYLGTPEENEAFYRERSPVTHVDNLAAPLLILHGENDPRVPVTQARVFREALIDAGYEQGENGDFEYQELTDEGHATTDQAHRRRMYHALDDFLQRRLPE